MESSPSSTLTPATSSTEQNNDQIAQLDKPENILNKLDYLRENSNQTKEQVHIRDQLSVNVFVNYEKLDQNGKPIDDLVKRQVTKKKESKGGENQGEGEAHDSLDDSFDTSEEEIDYNDDQEEEAKQVTHKYTIDLVANYKDHKDDLVIHWAMGKKSNEEWTRPDNQYLPVPAQTTRIDANVCQSIFDRNTIYPDYCNLKMTVKWVQDVEPSVKAINFVYLEKQKNWWHNNNHKNYQIQLMVEQNNNKEGESHGDPNLPLGRIGDAVREIIECETVYSSWTLMHRYFRCRDMLKDKIDQKNRDHMAYLYIWLRYSFIRQLTWQKRYNTKPRELQHSQVCLTDEICHQLKHVQPDRTKLLSAHDLLKSMLCLIGKGAGNGQQVRDEILHIMHRHHIKEHGAHFYEQWHQKLHNNTTPDDVHICEALLAYLRSNNMGDYWNVLHKNGIKAETLASYERKITNEPYYLPQTIRDFENYLRILKEMHSSGDLQLLTDQARRHVGGDTHGIMNDILGNFHDYDTLRQMERISKLRFNLHQHHFDYNNTHKIKDIIFLDLALEAQLRTLTEKIIHIDIGFEAYCREIAIILSNLQLSYQWDELKVCKDDWDKLAQLCARDLNEDNSRKMKSVMDRIKHTLGTVNDTFMNLMQEKAEFLGNTFGAEEYTVKLFAEELIRGSLFFSLSIILKKIDSQIRKKANLGDWLVISQGRNHGSRGYVERVKTLAEVMHKNYEQRTVLLVEHIGGEEEVPNNVQAIILVNAQDYPDVLAHVSVRARNLKVLLSVLFDEQQSVNLLSMEGKHLILNIEGSNVRYQEQNPNLPLTRKASSHLILQGVIDQAQNLKPPPMFTKSVMQMSEFNPTNMGAKSNNLKILQDKLGQVARLPESCCIPFQVLEYTLSLYPEHHKKITDLIERLTKVTKVTKMNRILFRCKEIIMSIPFNYQDSHLVNLKKQLIQFGIPTNEFDKAWNGIKKVWASKFNERAFLATKKIGVNLNQIFMAVLVQKIVPSEYAYVIHTTNPTNGDDAEVYVETCRGLGESLVSDMAGQALSFTLNKQNNNCRVNAYMNKPIELKSEGFIFRSDSNSEDLPGFAGAGLFDSYTMNTETEHLVSYNNDRMTTDANFRNQFMKTVGNIGVQIERLYNMDPQDIEGAFYNNQYYVVQTRPQV